MSAPPAPALPAIPPISIPPSPLLDATLRFVRSHSSPSIFNHVIRTTYLAFLAIKTHPHYTAASPKLTLFASLMHDLGWDPSKRLVSADKRYEVDGANAAVDFLRSQAAAADKFSEEDLSRIWHAIAMHCVPSVAQHSPIPEVGLIELVSGADFYGPKTPPRGWISEAFWGKLLATFPREGLREEFKEALCCLCREKPETTRDNFVADFGEWMVEGYDRGPGHAKSLDEAIGATDEETGLRST